MSDNALISGTGKVGMRHVNFFFFFFFKFTNTISQWVSPMVLQFSDVQCPVPKNWILCKKSGSVQFKLSTTLACSQVAVPLQHFFDNQSAATFLPDTRHTPSSIAVREITSIEILPI